MFGLVWSIVSAVNYGLANLMGIRGGNMRRWFGGNATGNTILFVIGFFGLLFTGNFGPAVFCFIGALINVAIMLGLYFTNPY